MTAISEEYPRLACDSHHIFSLVAGVEVEMEPQTWLALPNAQADELSDL